jgi:hypothetical protein
MVNDLIDGISVKLNQVFGDGKKIYSELVKQGLEEPCFYVVVLNPSETQVIGNRYFRQHQFDIHYFPQGQGSNKEINEMASDLFESLEYITLLNGDVIHGTGMKYEVVDGVLHFFVNYNLYIKRVEVPIDNMETLTVNNEVG